MKYEQRKETMLKLLKNSELVNMETLVSELQSSEATIRRDIIRLEKEGLIKRYWGGIKRIESENDLRARSLNNLFDESTARIGKQAAQFIESGDLIYIGSGATTLAMIQYLDKNQKITVVTNGIPQLEALYEKEIRALLLCGFYKEYSQSVVGTETSKMLERYEFDKAFIGANGIGDDYSILSADYYEDSLKMLAIKKSKKTYCLVKNNKFNKKAYYGIGKDLAGNVVLITDLPDKDPQKWIQGNDAYHQEIGKLLND